MDLAETARRNWLYKAAALALAVLLWIYVQAEQQGTQTFPVTLEREGLEAGYVLDPEPPNVVELKVRGPKSILANLSSRDFRARLSLSGAKPGPLTVSIQVDSPSNVQVISRTPSELNLNVDVLETRTVPVAWEYKGTLPTGYKMGDPTFQPADVVLSGPREKLKAIRKVGVQIPVGGKESILRSLPVSIMEPYINNDDGRIQISPRSVEVNVPITQEITSKTANIQPQVVGTPAKGYRVASTRVEPASVTVQLPVEMSPEVRSLSTSPVDITEAKGDVVRDVPLQFPNGIRPQNAAQGMVRVTVVIEAVSATTPAETVPPASGQTPTGGGTGTGTGTPNGTKEPAKEGQ
ncbi:hypothetical protein GJ688_04900 [Heliobacillus mobilis]|uniref:YbbR domain-containing protein n=1 Tax=Heliobacterium mobile TaxID=28064 RepID=A0A6I3SHR4_HELMO|nr:CdaR family protein [Heliobacterium mobile]MTV48322.1 hypothetical protein [Heliobacterium mobile]